MHWFFSFVPDLRTPCDYSRPVLIIQDVSYLESLNAIPSSKSLLPYEVIHSQTQISQMQHVGRLVFNPQERVL